MTHQPTRIALDRTKQLAGARLGLKASREALHPQEWPIDPQGSPSDKAGPPYSGVTCYIVDELGDRVFGARKKANGLLNAILDLCHVFETLGCVIVVWSTRLELSQPR
ncbi:hypothetical protein NC652_021200 [Populus alba x Populus x berolinensis]|nr:hypothetical protein NC652_021200 [Populus alba x Populus x berolinensis]